MADISNIDGNLLERKRNKIYSDVNESYATQGRTLESRSNIDPEIFHSPSAKTLQAGNLSNRFRGIGRARGIYQRENSFDRNFLRGRSDEVMDLKVTVGSQDSRHIHGYGGGNVLREQRPMEYNPLHSGYRQQEGYNDRYQNYGLDMHPWNFRGRGRGGHRGMLEYHNRQQIPPGSYYASGFYNRGGGRGRFPHQHGNQLRDAYHRGWEMESGSYGIKKSQRDNYTGGYRNNLEDGYMSDIGGRYYMHSDYASETFSQHHPKVPKITPQRSESLNMAAKPDKTKTVPVETRPCNICKKMGEFQCSRCKTPYCSADCQCTDWPTHRLECQQISSQKEFAESFENQFDVSVGDDMVDKFKSPLKNYIEEDNDAITPVKPAKMKASEKQPVATNVKHSDKTVQQKQTPPESKGATNRMPVSPGQNSVAQRKNTPPKVASVPTCRNTTTGIKLSRSELELGVEVNVIIVDVQSPSEIIVQIMNLEVLQAVAELGEKMLEVYSVDEEPVTNLSVGSYYAGKFGDGKWYRVYVKEVSYPDKILVTYIDYGNQEVVTSNKLRYLKPELAELPGQTIKCYLDGIKAEGQDSDWSAKAIERIKQLLPLTVITQITHKLTATKKTGNKTCVKILDANGCDVAQQLVDAGLAVSLTKQQTADTPTESDDLKRVTFQARDLGSISDTLSLGNTAVVYIAERITPVKFYVQIFDLEYCKMFCDYGNELQEIYSKMESFPFKPSRVGELVVGQYSVDHVWYRAEVLELTDSSAKLRYIDYGNTDNVDFTFIRPAIAKCCNFPAQTFTCELEGVNEALKMASLSEFPSETESLINELTYADKACTLDAVVKAKSEQGLLVDFIVNGSSVSKAICESIALEKLKEKQKPQVSSKGDAPPPAKQVIMAKDLSVVTLPCDTTVEMVMTDVTSLHSFHMRKADEASQHQLTNIMQAVDQYCKTQTTSYKPVVGEMVCVKFSVDSAWYRAKILSVDEKTFTVQYVDYGNCEQVTDNVIRKFDKSLASLPLQAAKCKLADLTMDMQQNEELLSSFASVIMGVNVKVQTRQCSDGINDVVILNSEGTNINEELIKYYNLTHASLSASDTNSVPSSPSIAMEKDLPPISVQVDGTKFPAVVTELNSLDSFYAKNEEGSSQLTELMKNIKSYCENCAEPHTPVKDELVCAKFSTDGEWYRAQVVDLLAGSSYQVQYIDFGNCDIVTPDNIRKFDASFTQLPRQAIRCNLSGVCFESQSEESLIKFAQIVLGSPVKIEVIKIKNDKYNVVLYAQDGTNINNQFKIIEADDNLVETAAATSTPQMVNPSASDSVVLKWNDAQKVEPSTSQFTVVITTVISPEEFYCQIANPTAVDRLAYIMQEMMLFCEIPSDQHLQLTTGDLCCGIYEDGSWYRSVVTEVYKNNTYQVQYVDFGNKAVLPVNKIRLMQSQFLELPILAFRCSLHDVAPKGGSWSEESSDSLRAFQDRSLTAHLVKKEDGIYVVNLTDDGMNIAQHMVASGVVTQLSAEINAAAASTDNAEEDQAALIQRQIAELQAQLMKMQTKKQ